MYLTQEEYVTITGNDISELDIIKYNQLFKSAIHPNNYMVEKFYADHGSYPLEVKLAIIEMVEYYSNNPGVISGLVPSSSVVGSTSVSYSDGIIKRVTSQMLPASVKSILLTTNVLHPTLCTRVEFLGTPYVQPMQGVSTHNATIDPSGSQGELHSVDTLMTTMPSINFKFSKENIIMDGVVDTGERSYDVVTNISGWYRSNTSGDDYSAVIIIPNSDYTPQMGDHVEYLLSGDIQYGVVNGCDEHLDYNGKVHHYLIYV